MHDRHITVPALAKLRRIGQRKILHWIETGELVAINLATNAGGRPRWSISPEALAEFDRRRTAVPEQQTPRRKAKLVAERYFEVTNRVMRGQLPKHLNLGCRLTPGFPAVVAEVGARYADVMSLNVYDRELNHIRDELQRLHRVSKKPVLLSEFSFPAKKNRSGNTNKGYERAQVEDDQERGQHYARCMKMLRELPFVVGCHWFQYYDEPTKGRADGENCNFGFVDLEDRIYEDLARSAAEANARLRSPK